MYFLHGQRVTHYDVVELLPHAHNIHPDAPLYKTSVQILKFHLKR